MATVPDGLVLCGPPCVGKTVSGRLVADALGWSFADADLGQAAWLVDRGWDSESFGRRVGEVGRHRAYLEYEALMADYLEVLLVAHPAGVLALGAGHAHARRPETAGRMVESLRGDPRPVVRLLPEPDPAASRVVLRARAASRGDDTYRRPGRDLIVEWVGSQVMTDACDHTLYTRQDGPAAVADRLVQLVAGPVVPPRGADRTGG